MRHRLRFVAPVLAALCIAGLALAEPIGSHWQLTPFGGFTILDGKLRFPGSNLPLTDDLHVGGRLAWQTRTWIGIEAAAGFSPTKEDLPGGRDFDWLHASGNLVLSPAQGRWGGPFLFAGGGWTQAKPSAGTKEETGTIEFGGGLRMWMTDNLGLRLEARDVSFKPLATTAASDRLHNMILGAGLTFALGGRARDTDDDGVPDKKDKCPGTPKGAKVDGSGCPIDSDGDAVFDGLDQCEGTPKGATVDAKGCPSDADGDGVFDGLDQCADTPKGLRVDAKGCPVEVTERETELLDTGMIRLQNVNFETNKADILPDSYPTLDAVGMLLTKWTQLKIEIGGHTDARGSAARNQKLSQARADSVRSYLVRRFEKLDPGQFAVKGYGKSRPIVPNTNELNWAKNRRVEFVVTNKDVLKKEVERRRLLQQNEAAPADSTKK